MTKKRKNKVTPYYKKFGFYLILIYMILTTLLIVQLFLLNLLPALYLIPIIILLIIFLIGLAYLQLGKKINKINSILGKFLIIILSIVLGLGNYLVFKTGNAVNKITDTDKTTKSVSVIVLKESAVGQIADLKNSSFGFSKTGDQSSLTLALADIKSDLGKDITKTEYSSNQLIIDDLFDKKIDAIIIDESIRSLYQDIKEGFDSDTKVIKTYKYTTKNEKKDNVKVNVTEDAFNIYISGIDTYGEITSTSRSDVNMIVTVNPKTHQILMTSVPRDFYIKQSCQNNQEDKLTHTGIFGVECTLDSMQNFMGITMNYYVRANFNSVESIVDAIGGIDIYNQIGFNSGVDGTYIPEGDIHIDGATALKFARERYAYEDGDRQRGRNQMIVLEAMIEKAISPSIITGYAGIMDAVGGNVQTNMSENEITSLIKMQIADMSSWSIYQIGVSGIGSDNTWTPANGFNAYVMVPDMDTVNNAVSLIKKVQNGEVLSNTDIQQQEQIVASVGN